MRNKLIELIQDATDEFAEEGWKHFECVGTPPFSYVPTIYRSEFIADHLIANGVTIATEARPLKEWHEDIGDVLWWKFPVEEPPYVGSPLDLNWPSYHTHWTPIVVPEPPKEQ